MLTVTLGAGGAPGALRPGLNAVVEAPAGVGGLVPEGDWVMVVRLPRPGFLGVAAGHAVARELLKPEPLPAS